jgi:hypothetical protein
VSDVNRTNHQTIDQARREIARSASTRPIAREAVAAGEGAFRTWDALGLLEDEVVHQLPALPDGLGPDPRRPGREVGILERGDAPATSPGEESLGPITQQLPSREAKIRPDEPQEPRIEEGLARSRGLARKRA